MSGIDRTASGTRVALRRAVNRITRFLVLASSGLVFACGGRAVSFDDTTGDGPDAIESRDAAPPLDADTGDTTRADGGDAEAGSSEGGARDSGRAAYSRCNDDNDCVGGKCVELTPGGFRVCTYLPPSPQPCTDAGPFPDECCGTCATGRCTLETSCGGAYVNPHNVCEVDECTSNSDCGSDGICLPTGVGSPYKRTCLHGNWECLTDSDCHGFGAGNCVMYGVIGSLDQCAPWACAGAPRVIPANPLRCMYESTCFDDSSCAPNQHCESSPYSCRDGVRQACPLPP